MAKGTDFDEALGDARQPGSDQPAFDFIEYSAPDGEKWRIERGADLIKDFELMDVGADIGERLGEWHRAMSGQTVAWAIICRLYGNAKLYGVEDPDELRVWTIAELAESRSVEPREIDSHLAGAKTFWLRWKLTNKEQGESQAPRMRQAPDEETARRLLRQNGFGEIENEEERSYIATRCEELSLWLDNETTRSATRSMIQQEVSMFFILDPTIRELRVEIARKVGMNHGSEKERKELLGLLSERRDMQTSLDASMKTLGLSDVQGSGLRKKLAFNDCLSSLILAIQKYHSEDDRQLIDGLFTAGEVEILTTPVQYPGSFRATQYRPDLILTVNEAKKHLWEADYSPTPLSRRACRKLAAGFNRGLLEASAKDGEVPKEDQLMGETILDENEEVSKGTSPAGPLEARAVNLQPSPKPRASAVEEAAAMFT